MKRAHRASKGWRHCNGVKGGNVKQIHMGVTKDYLRGLVRRLGPAAVVPKAKTPEEALEVIDAIPTPIYCTCDCRKDEQGRCTGEPA